MQFGDRIKQRRAELGITQHELAKRAEIAGGTMSSYESSRKMPPADVALRLAKALDVTVEWLLGEGSDIPLNTRADIVRLLLAVEQHIALQMDYEKTTDKFGNCRATIFVRDDELAEFAERFGRIRSNLEDKVIDEDVYNIWIEKELKKLDESRIISRAEVKRFLNKE